MVWQVGAARLDSFMGWDRDHVMGLRGRYGGGAGSPNVNPVGGGLEKPINFCCL